MTILSTADIAQEGAFLVPVLVLGFVMKGAHKRLSFLLTASENTSKIAVVIILGTTLNISLNTLVIPRFGILGAAGATAVSASLIFLLMYYYVTKEVAIPIPYKTIARGAIAAALMIGVLTVLPISGILSQLILYPIFGSIMPC